MPKSKREFLKAYEWSQFDEIASDQQQGLPRPELQKTFPPGAVIIDLIEPDYFTIGRTPVVDIIRKRASHRNFNLEALTLEVVEGIPLLEGEFLVLVPCHGL